MGKLRADATSNVTCATSFAACVLHYTGDCTTKTRAASSAREWYLPLDSALGAEMTRRRMKLAAPHAGEITVNTVRAYPAVALALTGAVAVGALLAARAFMRPSGLGALVAA
jgi:hypothetical protein